MKKSKHKYTTSIPETVSVRELQRTYRAVSDKLDKEGVLLVMNYSDPEMILVSKKKYENQQEQLKKLEEKLEIADTLLAYERSKRDLKAGKLIQANSIADLIKK